MARFLPAGQSGAATDDHGILQRPLLPPAGTLPRPGYRRESARNGERFGQLVNLHDVWGIETEGDHGVPRWERGSGATLRQVREGTVTHHGQEYRIESDDTISDHAAGRARYVPVA